MCKNFHKIWPQTLAAVIASLGYFCMGAVRAWTSPGLPSLLESEAIALDENDVAWIASLPPLCGVFSAILVTGPLEKYGRKWLLVLMGVPWIVGFVLVGLATNKAMLYSGRIISGLMEGTITPAAQIYICECSSPRIRGTLGSLTAANMAFGALVPYVLGTFLPWDTHSLALIFFPSVYLVGMLFMPESPVWLLTQGREDEAKTALQWLRGKNTEIEGELHRVRENVEQISTSQQTIRFSDFLLPTVWKPLVIAVMLMFFQNAAGIDIVLFYTVTIFRMGGAQTVGEHLSTIIVGVVQFVFTVIAAYVVDVFGRRVLLMTSGFFMTVALYSMGLFFYMQKAWSEEEAEAVLGWLPLTSLVVFIIAFSMGFNSVPFLIMGEIFPVQFRHLLSPITSASFCLYTFLVVRTFPDLTQSLGRDGTFWFYATCTALSLVFVYLFVPETKGKTLEDIELIFNPNCQITGDSFNGFEKVETGEIPLAHASLTRSRKGSVTSTSLGRSPILVAGSKALSNCRQTVDPDDNLSLLEE